MTNLFKIKTIPGKNRVLVIAPHGFKGDKSRGLEADDKNTGILADNLANRYGFYGVINEKYKKAGHLENPDLDRYIVNCNNINQVEKNLKKEFLDPIIDFKNEINARNYGNPLVVLIHGIGEENTDEYLKNQRIEDNVSILIGYGQAIQGQERFTADESLVNQFIKGMNAKLR